MVTLWWLYAHAPTAHAAFCSCTCLLSEFSYFFFFLVFSFFVILVYLLFEAVPSLNMLVIRVIPGFFFAFAEFFLALSGSRHWCAATPCSGCLLLRSADPTDAGRLAGQTTGDPHRDLEENTQRMQGRTDTVEHKRWVETPVSPPSSWPTWRHWIIRPLS